MLPWYGNRDSRCLWIYRWLRPVIYSLLSSGCSDTNTEAGVCLRPDWEHQNIPRVPPPPSTDSDRRHYTCVCLNITSPFFSSSSCHSSVSLSFSVFMQACRDEFRRDNCSTGATGDVHIWCTVVMSTIWDPRLSCWELGITHLLLSSFEL